MVHDGHDGSHLFLRGVWEVKSSVKIGSVFTEETQPNRREIEKWGSYLSQGKEKLGFPSILVLHDNLFWSTH